MDFTLPSLTQESFSRWYNKRLPRDDDIDERVVYPGIKLSCSTKSRDLRSQISPEHVFITQEKDSTVFHHKVLGSNNMFIDLPKRLYSHCFRNINIHSIPNDNRILVRLTESTSIILPFIPDDFVNQKRTKRSLNSRSKTKQRSNKKSKHHQTTTSSDIPYTGWVSRVLSPATSTAADSAIDEFRLKQYIRAQLNENDEQLAACIPNPFAGALTIDDINQHPDKQIALDTIVQFVHHYARNIIN